MEDSYDYVSEGFETINLKYAFPQMVRGDTSKITSESFRKDVPHTWYVTPDFPECGFLSVDEAHILYNTALLFKGKRGLEIGSHVGWSTVHVAKGGVVLDVVEPQLSHDPRVLLAIINSIRLASVSHAVNLHAGFSPEKVIEVATKNNRKWSFFFIDGNHNPGYPLRDARECEKYAEEDSIILFHDLVYPAVAEALKFLKEKGWKVKLYNTQQIMGAAYRGDITPVEHIPDPAVAWTIPDHLLELLE